MDMSRSLVPPQEGEYGTILSLSSADSIAIHIFTNTRKAKEDAISGTGEVFVCTWLRTDTVWDTEFVWRT